MSVESGYCLGLGETGSDVWRLLAQPTTVATLVVQLRETYQAPEGEIERDVQEFLEQMESMGLLETSPA